MRSEFFFISILSFFGLVKSCKTVPLNSELAATDQEAPSLKLTYASSRTALSTGVRKSRHGSLFSDFPNVVEISTSSSEGWGYVQILQDTLLSIDSSRYKELHKIKFDNRRKIGEFITNNQKHILLALRQAVGDEVFFSNLFQPLTRRQYDVVSMLHGYWWRNKKNDYSYPDTERYKGIDDSFPCAPSKSCERPTVFVTHAETKWCRPKSFKKPIENEIEKRLKSSDIVYLGTDRGGWFVDGVREHRSHSGGGEHQFVPTSGNVTLLGAFWGRCISGTINSIVDNYFTQKNRYKKKPLVLNIPMRAVAINPDKSLHDVWAGLGYDRRLFVLFAISDFFDLPYDFQSNVGWRRKIPLNLDLYLDGKLHFKFRTDNVNFIEMRLYSS